MMIHTLAITALFASVVSAESTAKQRMDFLAEMKSANLNLHPSERSLTKDQTPSLETFGNVLIGNSKRSQNYRNEIIKRAKYVSPEEIAERESQRQSPRNLGNNNNQNQYANSKYNYNNQGAANVDLYASGSDGNSYVASGPWSNAFGFDPTDYSIAKLRCAEVRQFDDELAAMDNSPSVFSTKHFAVFRFCPRDTCEGMTESQIEAEREEQYLEYIKAQNQEYADTQSDAYASWLNGDNDYTAYQAQMYVKQQADNAQENGESYEPPDWVFDKRVIGGADGSGCSSNYGEYMLEIGDYLQIMLQYQQERFEVYCDYCENCMYAVYQQWLKSNGRKLDSKPIHDQSWKEDLERHLDAESIRKLDNVYGTCPEYDTCKYYKKICGNDLDETYSQYFQCTAVQRNNGMVAYIGPHCANDGKSVTLGLYSDEECNEYIGDSFNINNFLGFTLEEGALDGYVSGSMASSIIPDNYFTQYWSEDLQAYYNPQEQLCIPCAASLQIYQSKGNINMGGDDDYLSGNNAYDDEVNDLCTNMYLAAAQCNKHFKSYSNANKNSKMNSYYSQQDISCEFIQSVVEGNYNELGFVNLDLYNNSESTGNILTNSIYYEEYGHYVDEVTPLQVFGLVASVAACALLALWATALGRSVTSAKAPWRPRRGVSRVAAPPTDMARGESGIALNRSGTMERKRSTSSYYMS